MSYQTLHECIIHYFLLKFQRQLILFHHKYKITIHFILNVFYYTNTIALDNSFYHLVYRVLDVELFITLLLLSLFGQFRILMHIIIYRFSWTIWYCLWCSPFNQMKVNITIIQQQLFYYFSLWNWKFNTDNLSKHCLITQFSLFKLIQNIVISLNE